MSKDKENMEILLARFDEQVQNMRGLLSREDTLAPNLVECVSCQELYPVKMRSVTGEYCADCFKEKTFGVIPPGTVRLGGGSPFYFLDEGDSPWGENAKRCMEGD